MASAAKKVSKVKPSLAAEILQADREALLKKVQKGRSLTAAERAVVLAENGGVDEDVETYAASLAELATVLQISRPTLDAWRKMPGAPKADAAGRHNTAAWFAFRDKNCLKGSEGAEDLQEKLRAIRLRNEDLELDLRIKFGEFTANDEVVEEFGRLAADQRELLRLKLEAEWPAKLPVEFRAAAREAARKLVDEICERNQKLIERYIAKVEAATAKRKSLGTERTEAA